MVVKGHSFGNKLPGFAFAASNKKLLGAPGIWCVDVLVWMIL